MPLTIIASSTPSAWERCKKRVDERRAVIESARTMSVKRINQDIERIAKREVEFAKKMFEEFVPVRLIWNEEAWENMKKTSPIAIEPIHKDEVVPEVIPEEKQ